MEEPLRLRKGSRGWWCLRWALEVKVGMEGNENSLDGGGNVEEWMYIYV